MRILPLAAALTLVAGLAAAQIVPDRGPVGPRSNAGTSGSATGATIPNSAARAQSGDAVPRAIPQDQAQATMKDKCGGTLSGLALDANSVWHAQCQKGGQTQAMSLGPDGNVQSR